MYKTITAEDEKEKEKVCGKVNKTKGQDSPLRVKHYCPKACSNCTEGPSAAPPTDLPTSSPTLSPIAAPITKTPEPSRKPTNSPSNPPSNKPTESPTDQPTASPSNPPIIYIYISEGNNNYMKILFIVLSLAAAFVVI